MSAFIVEGGRPLDGSVAIHGAKNSVLPILAACLLTDGPCVIRNCPDLSDVRASLEILRHLGCGARREGDVVTVDAAAPTACDVPDALMREMRSSVIFLGAILGRMGRARLCTPGGCELGPRPIDLHLGAIRGLGGQIVEDGCTLECSGALRGAGLTLAIPSVGATENAMLGAVCARGTTMIVNAAREPEIVDLQHFLQALGADVRGAGSSVIVIEGGKPLHGAEYTVPGDRIVAATYLAAAAAAGGRTEVTDVDWRRLSTVTSVLSEAGCQVRSDAQRIVLRSTQPLKGVRSVRTAPYPGFPTDAQPPLMAALCKSRGCTVFEETIFENRYRHAEELRRMGADIRVEGRTAVVCGVERLHGAEMQALDLRGGAALTVAALGAEGTSRIGGIRHIERGYQDMAADLRALGAEVHKAE